METATSTTTGRAVHDEASLSAPQKAKREEPMLVKLRAVEATPDSFAPFGQSIAEGVEVAHGANDKRPRV